MNVLTSFKDPYRDFLLFYIRQVPSRSRGAIPGGPSRTGPSGSVASPGSSSTSLSESANPCIIIVLEADIQTYRFHRGPSVTFPEQGGTEGQTVRRRHRTRIYSGKRTVPEGSGGITPSSIRADEARGSNGGAGRSVRPRNILISLMDKPEQRTI